MKKESSSPYPEHLCFKNGMKEVGSLRQCCLNSATLGCVGHTGERAANI